MAFGIPPLLNQVSNITSNITLAVADALLIYQKFQQPSWGIFNAGGSFAIIPDNIVSVGYQRQWAIASYPMEEGAFQSYNKVQFPFANKVQMSKGGTVEDKQSFLDALESISGSLDLFDIVTPEKTYFNVNIAGINYDRDAVSGAGLLMVNLDFQEIRLTATAKFSNVVDPNAADPVSNGTVQISQLDFQVTVIS
jgi:hypothetical protein